MRTYGLRFDVNRQALFPHLAVFEIALLASRFTSWQLSLFRTVSDAHVPWMYFETARPTEHADIIVYNDDPRRPAWKARTL